MAPKKSLLVLIIVLLTMAFVTVGCERAAYTPIDDAAGADTALATATADPAFPEAMASAENIDELLEFGAQTAQASASGEVPAPASETPNAETQNPPAAGETADPAANPTTVPPTETATTAPPAPAGTVPATYTLKQGEFPYCIARRYNVDPQEVLRINGLTAAQTQYTAGTVINLPQGGAGFPPPRALNAHPTTYTLPKNMTLYAVACLYGDITPEAIQNANSIADVYNIPANTVLSIP